MPKILLVEDNEMNRDMLSRRLLRLGYSVVVAEDGEEGHELAVHEHPDLIVMDVALPRMDGLEVTRLLKSNDETKQIPIIVLTAYSQNREKAFAAGCDAFASKPVSFRKLNEMIESQLVKSFAARQG